MELQPQHLELVFLASTVTSASGAGWVYTTTTLPQPRPSKLDTPPVPAQLAIISLQ